MDCTLVSQWREWSQKIWESNDSVFLINSFWSESEKQEAKRIIDSSSLNQKLIWIASSGSSKNLGSSLKFYGFSRNAFLVSAESVNSHLQAKAGDKWLCPLPLFHVGGFSIFVRSLLLSTDAVILEKWDPIEFQQMIESHKINFTSLVPTQVFDLVQASLKAPKNLNAVIVGGAKLQPDLYFSAKKLGWPLLPSFGMTEAGSQVATAELETLTQQSFPRLKILAHIIANVNSNSNLQLQTKSLFSVCLQKVDNNLQETLPSDPFTTNDLVKIEGDYLLPLGRIQRFEKILSEGIDLDELQEKMIKIFKSQGILVTIPEPRRGAQLVWVTGPDQTSDFRINKLVSEWNETQPGHHKLSAWIELEKIPISPLGKPLYSEIQSLVINKLQP